MANILTEDFSTQTTAWSDGGRPWSPTVVGSGSTTGISSGQGTTVVTAGLSRGAWVMDTLTARADQEILVKVDRLNTTNRFNNGWVGIAVSGTPSTASDPSTFDDGVFVKIPAESVAVPTITYRAANTNRVGQSISGASAMGANTVWVRLRLESGTLRVRIWNDGTAEPATWNNTISVASWAIPAGNVLLGTNTTGSSSSSETWYFDSITVDDTVAGVAGGYTAQTMTASGSMPDPVISTTKSASASGQVMTATAAAGDAKPSIPRNVSATALTASAQSYDPFVTTKTMTLTSIWAQTDSTAPTQSNDTVNQSLVSVVQSPGTSGPYDAFVTLSAVPSNAVIGRATLRVYVSNVSTPPASLAAYSVDTPFDILSISWNTRPARGSIAGPTISGHDDNQWVTLDITDIVKAIQAGTAYGLTFSVNTTHTLNTTDATNKPTITVDYFADNDTVLPAELSTASGLMNDATVAVGTGPTIAAGLPGTASALAVDPVVSTTSSPNVDIAADTSTATATMPGGKFTAPRNVNATALTANALGVSPTVATELNAVVRNTQPGTANAEFFAPGEVDLAGSDPYYTRIWNTTREDDLWFRLDETSGGIALVVPGRGDSEGTLGDVDINGWPDPDYQYEYVGDVQFGVVGPEARKAVKFVDGYLNRQANVGTNLTAFEVVFRTTKDGVLIWGSNYSYSGTTTSNFPVEQMVDIKNGKIRLSRIETATEITGFKTVTDGQWHHLVIINDPIGTNEADQRDLNKGLRVYIDGQLDIRRAVNVKVGIASPDTLFGAPSGVQARLGVNNFQGDVMETVLRVYTKIYNDDAIDLYYDAFGYVPFRAEPAGAVGAMGQGTKGKGNRKRALMISFTEDVPEGGIDREDLAFGPGITYGRDQLNPLNVWPRDFGEYKLFFKHAVAPNYNANTKSWTGNYYDRVTDMQRLINLQQDINIDDYDLIFFQSWPDESSEYYADVGFEYETNFRKLVEDLAASVRQAIVDGANIWVQSPSMAVDLGIIEKAELIPTMRDVRRPPTAITNYFSIFYGDDHAADIDPFPMGVYYRDTHANNRLRITANIEGLTDIQGGYVIDDILVGDRLSGLGDSYHYSHKFRETQNGLAIGEEFVNGTLYDEAFDAELARGGASDNAADENWNYNYYAAPPGSVKAGTVVARLGAKVWKNRTEIDNPYANYVSTIVLRPGDTLGGRQIGGKVFVNLSENAHWATAVMNHNEWLDEGGSSPYLRQIVPPNEQLHPSEVETPAERAWDYSTARMGTTSSTVKLPTGGGTKITVLSNGKTVTRPDTTEGSARDQGEFDGMTITIIERFEIYPTEPVEVLTLTERGLRWLGSEADQLEGTVVRPSALTATAEMPQPQTVAQHNTTVVAEPMRALGVVLSPDEATDGDVEVHTFAAEATAVMRGYGRTVSVEPMTATAEMVEIFDQVFASGEDAILFLHDVEVIMYVLEDA